MILAGSSSRQAVVIPMNVVLVLRRSAAAGVVTAPALSMITVSEQCSLLATMVPT